MAHAVKSLFALAMLTGCASGAASSEPEAKATVTTAPALRQGGTIPAQTQRIEVPQARMVPIAEACRGEHLMLDAELSPCACKESEYRVYDGGVSVRAGQWCGLPHPNEKSRPKIEVTAERAELASGEDAVVIVRVTNPGSDAAVYRVVNRHLWTRLVQSNGQPFPDAVHASGPYNDEALFELPPQGTMELRLPASASYDRWVGSGALAKTERAKLSPGPYAIEVFLGELGNERTRLIPIRVR